MCLTLLQILHNSNPRSHEGSDTVTEETKQVETISIHAPTRGATGWKIGFMHYPAISIHAPTRGATLLPETYQESEVISIHAPTRGATPFTFSLIPVILISIHAPTRGATNSIQSFFYIIWISIHAPTRGATICIIRILSVLQFQSTLPRGERHQFSPKSSLFSQQKLSKIFNLNNKLF